MGKIKGHFLRVFGLFVVISLSNCVSARQYNFSLKNTLSVFMLNDKNNYCLCIPVQYLGDYHIGGFDYANGLIVIGDYEIPLKRDEINISVYLKEDADEIGSSSDGFNIVYLEEKGKILLSKMNEPLSVKQVENDNMYTHYYIFIEKFFNNNKIKIIKNEYEKGNVSSRLEIWYNLIINNEPQDGNGMLDDFELYDGVAIDPISFPPNLNFFKAKYLLK